MGLKRTVIAVIITALLLCLTEVFWLNSVVLVSFRSDSSKDINYQVFYASKKHEKFTEVNSVKVKVNAGVQQKVKIALPVRKIVKFRLDIGNNPGKVTISNLKIKGRTKINLVNDDFLFKNIDTHKVAENKIVITSDKKDPYIIYKEKLKIKGKKYIDFYIFIILATFFFLLSYKTVNYLGKFKIIENNSRIDIVFVVVFAILLFVPMSNISDAEKSTQENRVLAKKPKLKYNNTINVKFGQEFEKWFNDRFFAREKIIDLYFDIKSRISLSGNSKVLVGKEDWLFYKKNNGLQNYANAKIFTNDEMRSGLEYLNDINKWCQKNNKKFYYLIAPDKNKIYGEYFRFIDKINPDTLGLGNQFANYIKEHSSITVIYPYDYLLNKKQEGLLYYKNDTHWNELGAYYGYKYLISEIKKDFDINEVKIDKWDEKTYSNGDLSNMYSITAKKYKNLKYKKAILSNNGKCENIKKQSKDRETVNCTNEKNKYNAFILRDSFTTALIPYYKETFKNTAIYWKYNIDKNDLDKIKKDYDIVILENVERYIPKIFEQSFPKD